MNVRKNKYSVYKKPTIRKQKIKLSSFLSRRHVGIVDDNLLTYFLACR